MGSPSSLPPFSPSSPPGAEAHGRSQGGLHHQPAAADEDDLLPGTLVED